MMLTVFPLYMRNHYSKMGIRKFEFFLAVSLACLLPAGALLVADALVQKRKGLQGRKQTPGRSCTQVGKQSFSVLDAAMLLYLAAVLISWVFGVDQERGWTGTKGWFMGLRTQLLLVLAYFVASRRFPWKKIIFVGHFLASGSVFLLGILHRFHIDPLGMYEGIDESYQLLFLSTIGQASWYSSYVCTVLVIGIAVFFVTENEKLQIAMGAYCLLGFATVVTQNSDSAFAAMAFLFLGLFLLACDSMEKMERFFELLLLLLGGFKMMGVFQEVFAHRAIELGGLSTFLSQSTATWLLFLLVSLAYMAFLFYRQKHPEQTELACGTKLRRAVLLLVPVGLFLLVLLIWTNTTGLLEQWTGFRSTNQYLLFDKTWGNSRGFSWKITMQAFAALPALQKLLGVGPDSYSAYMYADETLAGELRHFFGQNQTLTNAHNEFLNTLFCLGIVGLIAFASLFVLAFLRFYRARKKAPLACMGMLVVLVYSAHNFFCYQQVCCTPFLFLILGMAENLLRNSQKSADGYLT